MPLAVRDQTEVLVSPAVSWIQLCPLSEDLNTPTTEPTMSYVPRVPARGR